MGEILAAGFESCACAYSTDGAISVIRSIASLHPMGFSFDDPRRTRGRTPPLPVSAYPARDHVAEPTRTPIHTLIPDAEESGPCPNDGVDMVFLRPDSSGAHQQVSTIRDRPHTVTPSRWWAERVQFWKSLSMQLICSNLSKAGPSRKNASVSAL
jgi:hypothetical protein